MEKEFVNYNQALKLKALGFNEHCLAWYDINNILFSDITIGYEAMDSRYIQEDMNAQQCTAPTFSQAFRWFRKKYDCHHTIKHNKKYVGIVYSSVVNFSIDEFETYEEAELACLDKLIELTFKSE